jgi:hypothetical protein
LTRSLFTPNDEVIIFLVINNVPKRPKYEEIAIDRLLERLDPVDLFRFLVLAPTVPEGG